MGRIFHSYTDNNSESGSNVKTQQSNCISFYAEIVLKSKWQIVRCK